MTTKMSVALLQLPLLLLIVHPIVLALLYVAILPNTPACVTALGVAHGQPTPVRRLVVTPPTLPVTMYTVLVGRIHAHKRRALATLR